MKLSQATEALQRIGLSHYEALVFVNLARAGAATAGELARASGVNRVQTYRALDSLESRGLVEVILDRPRRYAALAVDQAFDMILGEKQAEIEAIDAIRKRLLQSWAGIGGGSRETPSVRLQIIKGRAQVYKTLRRLVAGARKEVLSFTTTRGLQRSYRAGVNDVLLEAMGRGVKPRFIADVNEGNRALMERIAARAPLRHVEGQRARFVLFDRDSILTFLIQDERTIRGDAETALWTNSPDFVRTHLEFFEKAWSTSTRLGERLAKLQK